ncbi:hypothetical protein D1872_181420 [compost metagenome]
MATEIKTRPLAELIKDALTVKAGKDDAGFIYTRKTTADQFKNLKSGALMSEEVVLEMAKSYVIDEGVTFSDTYTPIRRELKFSFDDDYEDFIQFEKHLSKANTAEIVNKDNRDKIYLRLVSNKDLFEPESIATEWGHYGKFTTNMVATSLRMWYWHVMRTHNQVLILDVED